MKAVSVATLIIFLCGQAAEAIQTCPSGNPRIAPDDRYTDNGNGTVTDNQTTLMWKQCSEGQSGPSCSGPVTTMNWSTALVTGANSSFAGFNDWRLPDAKELKSLVETACYNPPINETRFPNTSTGYYWTSSSFAGQGYDAFGVNFYDGGIHGRGKSDSYGVRLVRGGQ